MERVCERAYSAFGEEARRRSIDYRHDVAARPVIVTDGDRVLQIITNLLSNAFRWTPNGGRIGLAIARELAEALGGRLELESEPGQGSRFELVLPADEPS